MYATDFEQPSSLLVTDLSSKSICRLPLSDPFDLPPSPINQRFLVDIPERKQLVRIQLLAPEPRWLRPVLGQISTILALPQNWDSYDAPQVSTQCAESAIRILSSILNADSPPPTIVPTALGGMQIEWHRNGIDLEIEITPEQKYSGFFEDGNTGDSWEGDITFDPDPIRNVIIRLF